MKSELPGAGKGVFATRPIPKGAVICDYTGDVVVEKDPEYANPYALQIRERPPTFIDASKTNEPGEARWINDGRDVMPNNAELVYDRKQKKGYVKALRPINPGEEILVDYGKEYPWRELPKVPSRKKVVHAQPPKQKEPPPPPKKKRVVIKPPEAPDLPPIVVEPDEEPSKDVHERTYQRRVDLMIRRLRYIESKFGDPNLAKRNNLKPRPREIVIPKMGPKEDGHLGRLGNDMRVPWGALIKWEKVLYALVDKEERAFQAYLKSNKQNVELNKKLTLPAVRTLIDEGIKR